MIINSAKNNENFLKNDNIIYMDTNEQENTNNQDPGEAINQATLAAVNENDGKIILNFGDRNLEVRGDFYPNMTGGSPINPEYISALLEKFNIVYGVLQEEIDTALNDCVEERKIVRDVLVAKGDYPVNERQEYIQLNPLFGRIDKEGQVKVNENVDHRERSPFIIVRKDQALAKRKSKRPGKEGTDVHGKAISYGVNPHDGVSGGENTRMEGQFLFANISGEMIVTKGVVSVRDSLIIKGAVGYGTGNIKFPGNVEIEGPVSDGFKIYSGGSVTIKQTFDVTDVITKEDLTVSGGIIGRGQALVKVGGALKTKFIENCRVACRKTITVDSEIINSNIFTLETIEMADKGKIVSSDIYALKGLRAGNIGKGTGKSTKIHCGIDFTLEQEKEKSNGLLRILAAKLNRLRELMAAPGLDKEKLDKMEAVRLRLEEEQQKAQTRISEILGKLNTYGDAVVEVKGEIVPGTIIEICQTSLNVTDPLKRVRIRLDRENNKLVTENL